MVKVHPLASRKKAKPETDTRFVKQRHFWSIAYVVCVLPAFLPSIVHYASLHSSEERFVCSVSLFDRSSLKYLPIPIPTISVCSIPLGWRVAPNSTRSPPTTSLVLCRRWWRPTAMRVTAWSRRTMMANVCDAFEVDRNKNIISVVGRRSLRHRRFAAIAGMMPPRLMAWKCFRTWERDRLQHEGKRSEVRFSKSVEQGTVNLDESKLKEGGSEVPLLYGTDVSGANSRKWYFVHCYCKDLHTLFF